MDLASVFFNGVGLVVRFLSSGLKSPTSWAEVCTTCSTSSRMIAIRRSMFKPNNVGSYFLMLVGYEVFF